MKSLSISNSVSLDIKNTLINGDSLFQRESMFSGHLLKPIHEYPIYNNDTIFIWPIVVISIILILMVSIKTYDPKRFMELIISSFSLQASKQMFREDYRLNKRVPVFFSINYILLISFLAFKTNWYFNNVLVSEHTSLWQFLFFVGIITIVYIIKFLITLFFSYFLKTEDLVKEYLFNVLVFYHTLSIVLFPIIVLLQFSKLSAHYFLYPAFIITIGFYFLRLLRMLVISFTEQNIGIVHILLYFCALEILPLLVLIKFLFVNF